MTRDPRDVLRDAVAGVTELGVDPDSPGGAVALRFLLDSEGAATTGVSGTAHASPGDSHPVERIARWVGTDVERILDVVEAGDGGATIRPPAARLPRSKADRQRVLTLLKLAVDRVGYDVPEVRAQTVNALCSEYACADQNLPNNVAARGDLVARRGKRGAYVYRATQPGLERAHELFVELFSGDGDLRV